jgi:hypothetical protein
MSHVQQVGITPSSYTNPQDNIDDKSKVFMTGSTKFKALSCVTGVVGLAMLQRAIKGSESKTTLAVALFALPVILLAGAFWGVGVIEGKEELRLIEMKKLPQILEELKNKVGKFLSDIPSSEASEWKCENMIQKTFEEVPETERNSINFEYMEYFIKELKGWSEDLSENCGPLKNRIESLPDNCMSYCKAKNLSPIYVKNEITWVLRYLPAYMTIDEGRPSWGGRWSIFSDQEQMQKPGLMKINA